MVPVRWSTHAADVVRERNISPEWVVATLEAPERTEADPNDPSLTRAYRRIPGYGNRWLRAVYRQVGSEMFVVTVFFDRNAGR